MTKQQCRVEGCDRESRSRGWCHTHYVHWHRLGEDPPAGAIPVRLRGPAAERLEARTDRSAGPAGCHIWNGMLNAKGYGVLRVSGRSHLAHRIAYEEDGNQIAPGQVIDHRCGVPACVNPKHLRACAQKQNMENLRAPYATSTSGVRGVSWHRQAGKWRAHVTHNRRTRHLGMFDRIEDAEAAVVAKRIELFTHNDADRN